MDGRERVPFGGRSSARPKLISPDFFSPTGLCVENRVTVWPDQAGLFMNTTPQELIIEVWERQWALGENEARSLMKQLIVR
jgi:hypothetical protein